MADALGEHAARFPLADLDEGTQAHDGLKVRERFGDDPHTGTLLVTVYEPGGEAAADSAR